MRAHNVSYNSELSVDLQHLEEIGQEMYKFFDALIKQSQENGNVTNISPSFVIDITSEWSHRANMLKRNTDKIVNC